MDCTGLCGGDAYLLNYFQIDADSDGFGIGDSIQLCSVLDSLSSTLGYTTLYEPINPFTNLPDDNCSTNLYDECGICTGFDAAGDSLIADGYIDNCLNNAWGQGCVQMDCSGNCFGDAFWGPYYTDLDGDSLGSFVMGSYCSHIDIDGDPLINNSEANPAIVDYTNISGDDDDSVYCLSNNLDMCGICDGPNEPNEITDYEQNNWGCGLNNENCPDIDCSNTFDNLVMWNFTCFGNAFIDYCGECSYGNTGKVPNVNGSCSIGSAIFTEEACVDSSGEWTQFVVPQGPNVSCDGVCNSESSVDECGVCNGPGPDPDGECKFSVYPGDANGDGTVSLSDILPIGKYWGYNVQKRNISSYTSEFAWEAQKQELLYLDCASFSDVNGNGLIEINDVIGLLINMGKSHSNYNYYSEDLLCHLEEDFDRNAFYEIYNSINDDELKDYLSNKFNFEKNYEFALHPNYPNPFNPKTNIVYELAKKSDVTIIITNILGQKIIQETLYNKNSGQYLYAWDGTNYSSGIYFFSLYINNELLEEIKMVLIK